MVTPVRFERTTLALEGRCSIQLSYGAPEALRTTSGLKRIQELPRAVPRILSPEQIIFECRAAADVEGVYGGNEILGRVVIC